jgi:2-octaprenyl-6-methoxyphenol hydroxylase
MMLESSSAGAVQPVAAALRSAASAEVDLPVVVLGGGPVGLVCALLLDRAGIGCAVLDARPLEALQRDRRLLALSRGSLLLLESLLGSGFAPMAPIERVHVSSRGDLGAAHLSAQDFDGTRLGATVWYADLVAALDAAAQARSGIRLQRSCRAGPVQQLPDRVRIALDDGSCLEARLAVDAEGTPARAMDEAAKVRSLAMLADLDLAALAPGDAVERFTREGPLALLPLPPAGGARAADRVSMIWCQPAALAQERMQWDDARLCRRIGEALGPRWGTPAAIGPRLLFPLVTHRLERVYEHRLVHLGNAAQTLHPVAGQGFNLGLRDCACLAECLADSRVRALQAAAGPMPAGFDPAAALARYGRRRRIDRRLLPALTGVLPPLFSSNLAPVVACRSAALVALDVLPGLRRSFTRLLMFGAG